jgi:polyferredoxin
MLLNAINRLFRLRAFPLALQFVTLGGFIVVIALGMSANTEDPSFAKVLRNTNVANLIVWSYWWPLIILSAIFLGRVWCTVCPMELLTSLATKMGLKRQPPAFLRSGWVMTAAYVVILFVGIQTLSIHRIPFRMALYLLALASIALVSGLLFRRNTFCASICPVGHILGIYARLAPVGWGVQDETTCSKCADKSCVSNKNTDAFLGRSCGVGLYPANIDDNSDCILCGQCLKACNSNGVSVHGRPNPGWLRRPWFKDLLDLKPLTGPQAAFVFIVSGFVIYEVFTEWGLTKQWLLWLPMTLDEVLGATGHWTHGLIKSLTLFVGLPALIWLLPYGLFRFMGGRLPLRDYALRFGIAFIPIMAAAHAIKALLKMTSRIPYWQYVVADPIGAETAHRILDNTTVLSALPAWRDPVITVVSLLLMTGAIVLSWVIVRKLNTQYVAHSRWRSVSLYLIPGFFGGAFFAMLTTWRAL